MSNEILKTEIMRALRAQVQEDSSASQPVSFFAKAKAVIKRMELNILEAKIIEEQISADKQKARDSLYF